MSPRRASRARSPSPGVGPALFSTSGDTEAAASQKPDRLSDTWRERGSPRTGRGAQRSEKGNGGAGLVGKGHGGTLLCHGGSLGWAVPSGTPAWTGPAAPSHGQPRRDKGSAGLSGFPGSDKWACLGSDRGQAPRRLATGGLSAHRCPLCRYSYLRRLTGSPLAPQGAPQP